MVENLWATPVLRTRMSEELAGIVSTKILLDQDMMNPVSDFSTKGILDASEEMVRFKEEAILPAFNSFLRNTLGKELEDWASYRTHGWLAGTGNDYSINYHNHSGAQLSAVFYLLCEEQDSGGQITFTDPRQNANRGYDSNFSEWFKHLSFTPKSGDIVVFPSFLYHFVSIYQGNIRLAIPVDLFLHTSK